MKLDLVALSLFLSTSSALPFGLSWIKNSQSILADTLSTNEKCLIKLGPDAYQVVTEAEKFQLKRDNINFIDVTNQISIDEAVAQGLLVGPGRTSLMDQIQLLGSKQVDTVAEPSVVYKYPEEAKFTKSVKSIFKDISADSMRENLGNFTSFYTRYYKSKTGYESAIWLEGKINELISDKALKRGVTVTPIDHQKWDQFSIVVSIPGKKATSDNKGPIVVIGSHQDSTNLLFPNTLRAPGADDNGSGTVTCLESLRLLLNLYDAGEFTPENTLEFHFYSAEEGGLLGSIDVFTRYKIAGEKVLGMLQQDMTGYTTKSNDEGVEPHVGLIIDYTTPTLNNFVKLIIDTYCNIPYHESSCGYACSDHSSAVENGYPASFVIESEFELINRYIHSVLDTIDRIDWDHVVEHVKLTVGFAYELSNSKVKEVEK